jgi:superfamily II DNA/RNA helicase
MHNIMTNLTVTVARISVVNSTDHDDATDHSLKAGKRFTNLNIPASCLRALTHDLRLGDWTEIQSVTIPIILQGRNMIAQAEAGSGKSIDFSIGILNQVTTGDNSTQAICISPTRQLAHHLIYNVISPLARYIDPPCRVELAGRTENLLKRDPSQRATSSAHITVGTAGTICKWMKHKYINLSMIEIFVIDEADSIVIQSQNASTQILQMKSKLPKNI